MHRRAQTRKTEKIEGRELTVYGGDGITKDEMRSIFSSVRDLGSNGRGGYKVISKGESALLQMLDAARDDRRKFYFTDSDGRRL